MNKFNFRAWYIPGFVTNNRPQKFVTKLFDNKLYFTLVDDTASYYPFEVPFIGSDWILERSTGFKSSQGEDIFEGDIIKFDQPLLELRILKNIDNLEWVVAPADKDGLNLELQLLQLNVKNKAKIKLSYLNRGVTITGNIHHK